ncbi:hypothetical protein FRC17_004049, partial [Serendipita sp. 399]
CDDHSAHLTGLDGARVALSFYGVGLEFYGNVTLGLKVQVTVDGTLVEPTSNVVVGGGVQVGGANSEQNLLTTVSGLPIGQHAVVFTVQAGADRSLLTFDKLRIIVGHAASFNRTVIDGTDEVNLIYGPPDQHFWSTWNNYEGAVVPPGVSNTSFRASDKKGATIYKKFTGSAYLYYGPCYTNTGSYTLLLDGTANTQPVEYNASVPYQQIIQGCLRGYAGGLSKSGNHEVSITNNQEQSWLTMNWLEIWDLELVQEQQAQAAGGGGSGSGNGAGGSTRFLSHTPNVFFSLFSPLSPSSPLSSPSTSPTMVGGTGLGSLALYTILFRAALAIFQ